MGASATSVVDKARRQIEGYAADGLCWQDFAAAVIEAMGSTVPYDAMCFATVDPATNLFTSLVRDGIDDSKDDLFMEIELTKPDPITLTALVGRADGVGILADHITGDPHSNPRCRELLGPHFDLEHELRGVGRIGGRMWAAAALYRAPTRRGFTADDAAVLSALEDTLVRGVQRSLVASTVADLDEPTDAPAVLIIDVAGRLEHSTPAGADLLGLLGWVPGGPLPTAVRSTAAAARAGAAGGGGPAVVRHLPRTGEWLLVRAAPLHDVEDRVAVTIEPGAPGATLQLMIEAYGLTARETAVVRGVIGGGSTAELAASLDITRNTVQDHLKAVFRKVGVSSRRELVARLSGRRSAPTQRPQA